MMKKITLLICLSIAAIIGCKKSDEPKPKSMSIIGNWELRNYSGTIAGVNVNVPKNSGNILVFHADSTYERYDKSKLSSSGKFSIAPKSVAVGNVKYDGINFNDNVIGSYYILRSDTLTISDNMDDGVTSVFVKVIPGSL